MSHFWILGNRCRPSLGRRFTSPAREQGGQATSIARQCLEIVLHQLVQLQLRLRRNNAWYEQPTLDVFPPLAYQHLVRPQLGRYEAALPAFPPGKRTF